MSYKIPKETKVGDLDFIWSTQESVVDNECVNMCINMLTHWYPKGLFYQYFENKNFLLQPLILQNYPHKMCVVNTEHIRCLTPLCVKQSLHMKQTLNTSVQEVCA